MISRVPGAKQPWHLRSKLRPVSMRWGWCACSPATSGTQSQENEKCLYLFNHLEARSRLDELSSAAGCPARTATPTRTSPRNSAGCCPDMARRCARGASACFAILREFQAVETSRQFDSAGGRSRNIANTIDALHCMDILSDERKRKKAESDAREIHAF